MKLQRRVNLIKFVGINFKNPVYLKGKDEGILEAAWGRVSKIQAFLFSELRGIWRENTSSPLLSSAWSTASVGDGQFQLGKESSEKKLLKKRSWLLICHMLQKAQQKVLEGGSW